MFTRLILGMCAVWLAAAPLAQVITPHPGFHPRYKELLRVNGTILDADGESVVYVTQWPEVHLFRYDLQSGTHTLITTNAVGRAQLIPDGGVVMELAADITTGESALVQWNGGEEIQLGLGNIPAEYSGNEVVNGRFGVLHIGIESVLRDFVARTNYALTLGTRARYVDVAENGNAIFTTSPYSTNGVTNSVFWLEQGALQTLMVANIAYPPHVQTDGTNYLWCVPGEIYFSGTVNLQTASGLEVLSTNLYMDDLPPSPFGGPDVYAKATAMNGGWLATAQRIPGTLMIAPWRRAPDGTFAAATTFPSYIKALRADGGLLVTTRSALHFISADGVEKNLGPEFYAKCFFVGDKLRCYREGLLNEVDIEGDPFALTSARYNAMTGTFSYDIYASGPGTFVLQRSTDFVNWTEVATNTITEGFLVNFEVATEPGFFRLTKNSTAP
jgi:hypothetical protein